MTQPKTLTPLDRSLLAIRSLQERVKALESAEKAPIAIVGIGCRFPGGVTDPESFWRLLRDGVDAITEVPPDRWDADALYDPDPDRPGKSTTRWGGFLDGVDRFDPAFFGITAREATGMDPQQRLLLEVSWESLEHAGIVPASLEGSDTGVFVGLMWHDYRELSAGDLTRLDPWTETGVAASVASGRLSYVLGLKGPSLTVDTACSSSLVTLHLACQSLRSRECSLALAGGVNLVLTPRLDVSFSRMHGLASDGRCKSFSAAADGVVWGDGCGVLVLERLEDARRNGHTVLAVIRGSAVNQDGRSNGLTAPNGPAQEAVIRRALAEAGVRPARVSYVETHGTGTALGDPIEAQALGAVLKEGRGAAQPVWLGAVKTNIGHTTAAAGVASVIKTVLALQHGCIPKNLHFDAPSSYVDWNNLPLRVPTEAVPWERGELARIAGVSSFGISGTNAHVILEEGPAVEVRERSSAAAVLPLLVSGADEEALRRQAGRLAAHLRAHPEQELDDVAWALAKHRTHFSQRGAVAGRREDAVDALCALARGETHECLLRGVARGNRQRAVFIFSGQGSQWPGMASALYSQEPAFREVLGACDAALRPYADDWSLLEVVASNTTVQEQAFLRVDIVQPVLFALACALFATWRSWGVSPAAVIGHSQGEIAAAWAAGALTLEEAARVVALRSRCLRKIAGRGLMGMVSLPAADLSPWLEPYEGRVSVAVVNSRSSTVISGEAESMRRLLARAAAEGLFCREIAVDYASHSAEVQPILADLREALMGLSPRPTIVPMCSTVTGELLAGPELDGSYWATNLRQPVRFDRAVTTLRAGGHSLFLEVSAHPTLLAPLSEILGESAKETGAAAASLRRGSGDRDRLLWSAAELHVHGGEVDWRLPLREDGRRVALPTYAFKRERFWLDSAGSREAVDSGIGGRLARGDVDALADDLGSRGLNTERDGVLETLRSLVDLQRESSQGARLAEVTRRLDWVPLAMSPAYRPVGPWLIVSDDKDVDDAARIAAAFESRGWSHHHVYLSDGAGDDAVLDAIRAVTAEVGDLEGLIRIAPRASRGDEFEAAVACLQAVATAARAMTAMPATPKGLWVVTSGGVAVSSERDTAGRSIAHAAVWGLGRSLALEVPEVWGGLVDLPAIWSREHVVAWLGALAGGPDEDQIAIREEGAFVPRLEAAAATPQGPLPIASDGAYLVTGGTGLLGLAFAEHLVRRGARHVVLTSRGGGDEAANGRIRALSREATVEVARCDVAEPAAMTALLGRFGAEWPQLRGIIHTAGTLGDGTLDVLGHDVLARTLRPKLGGLLALQASCDVGRLDFLLLVSSVAGVVGLPGKAAYAAANAALNGAAQRLRAARFPAWAIDLGLLGGGGMAGDELAIASLSVVGHRPMSAQEAVALMDRLGPAAASSILADIDWPRFAYARSAVRPQPMLSAVLQDEPSGAEPTNQQTPSLRQRLASAPDHARQSLASTKIREIVTHVMHMRADTLDMERPLRDYGLDSLMAVQIRDALRREECPLPIAMIVKGPPAIRLLAAILTVVAADATGSPPAADATGSPPAADAHGIQGEGWLVTPVARPTAEVRLICFPYAGGGPVVFDGWAQALPESIEVSMAQLPGRAARIGEQPLRRMGEVVDGLVAALIETLDRPFAFFGHCLGAVIAFEVARRIRTATGREPVHFFVSGARAPCVYTQEQLAEDVPQFSPDPDGIIPGHLVLDEQLLDMLADLNFAESRTVLEDAELRALMLPVFRADLEINNTYFHEAGPPLSMDITAMGGRVDPYVPRVHLKAWSQLTTGRCDLIMRPGDHYFIRRERDTWLELVRRRLALPAESSGLQVGTDRP